MINNDEILKFNMSDIFSAISDVYGKDLFDKFILYIKEMYDLDPLYTDKEIIDTMEESELALNISIFFDSEDERHVSQIGIKDTDNKQLIDYLRYKTATYNEWIIFEDGCELPNEWEGVIVAAPQHKSKTMHCVFIKGEFHTLGIRDHVIIPKKFMRIDVSNITMKDSYTYKK